MKRAALCVLLTVAVSGCGGSAQEKGQPLPARFVPLSLSALDSRNFLLLGTLPCAAGRCYAIERTADSGRSFTRLPAPHGLPTEGTNPPLPTEGTNLTLRFADAGDGFIWVPFGWGEFWSTHDSGATWRRLTSRSVVSFTTAGGNAYAVVAHCTIKACTGYRFARGAVSASRWKESALPFTPDGPVLDLAARGQDVWVLAAPGGTRYPHHDLLARSTDSGRTFIASAGPCVPGLGGTLEPSSAHIVWAICPTGLMAGAVRSTNGGVSFTPLHAPPLVNSAQLAPASDETAVLAANGAGSPLYRTTDGGATWRPLAPRAKDDYLYDIAFTDAQVGEALVQGGAHPTTVWRTTDGGITWAKIPQR